MNFRTEGGSRRVHASILFLAFFSAGVTHSIAVCDPIPARHAYVEDTNRLVGIYRGDWLLIGRLDKNGDFIQQSIQKAGSAGSMPHILNPIGQPSKAVYEYRSAVLIPGKLIEDGSFVPDIDGKAIHFKHYRYKIDAVPIWNLPGKFILK